MDTVTKIEICWSLYRQGVSPEKIPEEIGKHRATVYRWLGKIKRDGIRQYIRDFRASKKGRRQRKTDAVLKDRIYKIREEKRQCCGEKIQYYLHRDHGLSVCVSTIYRVLNEKYELRNKWRKNMVRGKVMLRGCKPREVLQVDSVNLGSLYDFTAIDTFTREDLFSVQREVDRFLSYYHYDRPHLSLNMLTPHQFAMSHLR